MGWSDLEAAESAAGARFCDLGSNRFPKLFSSLEQEWQAVRKRVGVLDGRTRQLLSLTGGDRTTFLQGMISNDVAGLAPGQGTYAALLTIQGRIVSDLYVYVLTDRLLLDVPQSRAGAVREALERYIVADDVEFEEPPPVEPLLALEGPDAAATLAALSPQPQEAGPAYGHRSLEIGDVTVRCVAVSQTGENGYRLLGSPDAAAPLWRQLIAVGAQPVGFDALAVLRLEAGIPWHGVDMDEDTLAMEVGLEGAISFSKGCYLGQEVVERVSARGHVNRKLCGMTARGSLIPPAGTPLSHDGKEVGHITSAAHSPARSCVIALGYLHRAAAEPATIVHAQAAQGQLEMEVTALPFYRRPSKT